MVRTKPVTERHEIQDLFSGLGLRWSQKGGISQSGRHNMSRKSRSPIFSRRWMSRLGKPKCLRRRMRSRDSMRSESVRSVGPAAASAIFSLFCYRLFFCVSKACGDSIANLFAQTETLVIMHAFLACTIIVT